MPTPIHARQAGDEVTFDTNRPVAVCTPARRLRLVRLLGSIALALAAGAGSASAAIIGGTISGVFTAGSIDQQGLLTGTHGKNLTGYAFQYTVSYDSTMPFTDAYSIARGDASNRSYFDNSNSYAIYNTLDIGTVTAGVFTAAYSRTADNNGHHGVLDNQSSAAGAHTLQFVQQSNTADSSGIHVGLNFYFTTTAAYVDGAIKTQAALDTYLAGMAGQSGTGDVQNYGFWDNGALSFTITSAQGFDQVPEPASLAILGAGIAGIRMVRRRRRA